MRQTSRADRIENFKRDSDPVAGQPALTVDFKHESHSGLIYIHNVHRRREARDFDNELVQGYPMQVERLPSFAYVKTPIVNWSY